MNRNYEGATTPVAPLDSLRKTPPPKAAQIYPILSLLSIILLFLSAGAGISLSAIVLFLNLESTEYLDPLSRAVFFVASCVSLIYVLTHIIAARTAYTKGYGSTKFYGKYVAGFAFLLARLGLPVWVAAITLAIFVAVNVGLDLSKGIRENMPWLNVIISISSLFSLCAVLAVIEMADRPFATIGLSQTWFIRGENPFARHEYDDAETDPKDEKLMSYVMEKDRKQPKPPKNEKRKRKTLTKRNPYEGQHRSLRHARSMSMPAPLNTVFGDDATPQIPELQSSHTAFAWKPPTREGTPRPAGALTFEDLDSWRQRNSLRHVASDISTNASAPSDDVILPSMPRQVQYSPRSQALLLEQQRKYDSRRWTAIGTQSPPYDAAFLDAPFRRPRTPLMAMEDERRIMGGHRPSTRDSELLSNYHSSMTHDGRSTMSHSSRASRIVRTSQAVYTVQDEPPSLPPIATTSTWSIPNTNSILAESDTLPNVGRRRRKISNYSDSQRLTHGTGSRLLSETYRPSSQHPSIVTQESPQLSPVSMSRSELHNFSRPRTSAAARMQSKVSRRLRAMKQQQETPSSGYGNEAVQAPTSPSTLRAARAAAVSNLQEKLGQRNQVQQSAEDQRPPSPETPRTTRAMAVKTLQERIGKRMMRRNESEAASSQLE
ncbi:uncharacterized protein CTRU02_206816 [Colletotrichum truncatum]|uniref:Uncharacterized protein n=1 Tax=Colletotrichum truncatum TaxID=5467 RepID=A0ACC3YYS1_COLTU|nr:uncharacterized protein CTRU02_14798 [Colletotrichum truncatum]KAF6781806.1 hypothetical protein CTRU02_14798 [Colletotrichum truncatum]